MGRITVPFAYVFGADLETIKVFSEKLKDKERRAACDAVIRACTAEQGPIKNANIPDTISAMELVACVDAARELARLEKRVLELEEVLEKLRKELTKG